MNNQPTLPQHPVDMMSLGFTKLAGFHPWTGYSPDFDWNYTHFWKHTIRAQYHMNGDDVINTLSEGGGDWRQEKQYAELNNQNKKYAVEHQYYISQDQSSAVGYVKNRTFNIRTQAILGSVCTVEDLGKAIYNDMILNTSWNDVNNSERLRIARLKSNTDYRVDWYSLYKTQSGGYMKSDCMNTNLRGGLWGFNLEYPDLWCSTSGDVFFPVVWYVIHEGCNSGLAPLQPRGHANSLQQIINEDTITNRQTTIYPNPFEHILTVNSLEDDIFVISTLTGSVIKQINIHKGKNILFVSELSKGIYLGKLIKQQFITKLLRL